MTDPTNLTAAVLENPRAMACDVLKDIRSRLDWKDFLRVAPNVIPIVNEAESRLTTQQKREARQKVRMYPGLGGIKLAAAGALAVADDPEAFDCAVYLLYLAVTQQIYQDRGPSPSKVRAQRDQNRDR